MYLPMGWGRRLRFPSLSSSTYQGIKGADIPRCRRREVVPDTANNSPRWNEEERISYVNPSNFALVYNYYQVAGPNARQSTSKPRCEKR